MTNEDKLRIELDKTVDQVMADLALRLDSGEPLPAAVRQVLQDTYVFAQRVQQISRMLSARAKPSVEVVARIIDPEAWGTDWREDYITQQNAARARSLTLAQEIVNQIPGSTEDDVIGRYVREREPAVIKVEFTEDMLLVTERIARNGKAEGWDAGWEAGWAHSYDESEEPHPDNPYRDAEDES